MPDEIRTERLRLRAWTEDDADAVLALLSHDDVWPWLGADPAPCRDLEAARTTARRWGAYADPLCGLWAVEALGIEVASPQPCGTVLLMPLPRSDGAPTDTLEIGWFLHPGAWGHGIASEGVRALVARARAHGVAQLHAVVYPGNVRSLAVCDRLGMTRLGETDEWYERTFVDHVLDLAMSRAGDTA